MIAVKRITIVFFRPNLATKTSKDKLKLHYNQPIAVKLVRNYQKNYSKAAIQLWQGCHPVLRKLSFGQCIMKLYLSCPKILRRRHQVVTQLSSCGQADIQLSPIKCHLLPCCQIAVNNSNIGMSNFHFLSWNLPPKQESLANVIK